MININLDTFEDWLVNKELRVRTIESYMYYFFRFKQNYSVFNQETAMKFFSEKRNRNKVGKSFLINFKKFLMQNHKALDISMEDLADIVEMDLSTFKAKGQPTLVKPIAHKDIALLEEHLPTERLKIQLLLSYYCALRLGEALKVRFRSFNWEEWGKDMTKMGECRVMGKGGKPGIALVPGVIMNRISHFFKSSKNHTQNSFLFLKSHLTDEEINVKNKARAWQMALRKAGKTSKLSEVDDDGKVTKETAIYPHRLRHSYATYLLNVKKLNIREVQEVLRHSSITSTQIYTHIKKEELKEKLNK